MSVEMGVGVGMAIGVYGKVRSQPDFLRANAGEFSQAGLDRWFQDAMEIIRTEKTALPAGPTAFVLTPSDSGYAFIGAFVPGTDAAGRLFPLAVFATIPAVRLSGSCRPCRRPTNASSRRRERWRWPGPS